MTQNKMTFYEYVEKRRQIPLYYWQRKAADAFLREIRHAEPEQGKTFLLHQLSLFLDEVGDDFELEDDRDDE